MPRLTASRAQASAATVAANGVDFFEPLKPALPELPHVTTLPLLSVMVTSVLLNVALICATPSASTCLRARLVRGPPFFFCSAIYQIPVAVNYFFVAFFLPAIATRLPFKVRALVCVR